jgi:hypothetical protein
VKRRLASWTFGLSRPSTRKRYRAEFEDLLDELVASGDTGRHLWLETALAAGRDRLYGLKRARPVVFAGTVVLTTALALVTWTFAGSPVPSTRTTTLMSVHLLPHPVDGSVRPETGDANCPNPPQLSSTLPSGASISAPSIVPTGTSYVTAAGVVRDLSGTCEYTLRVLSVDQEPG